MSPLQTASRGVGFGVACCQTPQTGGDSVVQR
jgi:hypothetical protein